MNRKLENWKETLTRMLPVLVLVFCVMQPLLDVAGFWQGKLEFHTPLTTLLRMGLFAGSAALGFFLSDRKRYYVLLAAVLGAFAAVRSVMLLPAGYAFAGEDLMNLIRLYMLPIYTLSFCTFVRRNGRVVRAILTGFAADLGIVAVVMLLSRLTGTDPFTYPNKELGVQGWFLYGNVQSAILSMLVPVALGWALKRWETQVLPVALAAIVGEGALFLLATRLSCAAFVAAGFGMAVSLLLIDRTRWRQAAALVAVTAVLTALLPVSPMTVNQKRVAANFDKKQEAFDAVARQDDPDASEEEKQQNLVEAYRLYVPGLITRFGGEKTLEAYNSSTNVDQVGNRRNMRLTFCRLLQEDSPESARWFGMDVTRMKVRGVDLNWATGEKEDMITSFDPENDFHAVYYLYGAVGLALTAAFFVFFALRGLYAMARDFRCYFSVEFAAVAIACCTDLAHCIFTSSTLRHINSSAYLALVLAALWYLSRRELSSKRMKTN